MTSHRHSTFYEKLKIRDSKIPRCRFLFSSVLVAISAQEKSSKLSDLWPLTLPQKSSFPKLPVKPQHVTWNV